MTAATALAAGTLGGTLFAFSTFVMPALDALPSGQAIEAMQAINDRAPRSLLMVPLAGSAAGSLATGLLALWPGAANRARLLAGSAAILADGLRQLPG